MNSLHLVVFGSSDCTQDKAGSDPALSCVQSRRRHGFCGRFFYCEKERLHFIPDKSKVNAKHYVETL